jgi:hypothetical protein
MLVNRLHCFPQKNTPTAIFLIPNALPDRFSARFTVAENRWQSDEQSRARRVRAPIAFLLQATLAERIVNHHRVTGHQTCQVAPI